MPPESIESQAESLLAQMSLEEKVAFCHANSPFCSNGCPRLGISDFVYSDGPHGVRAEVAGDWSLVRDADDAITYFPVGIALGATWNKQLAHEFGQALGAEARARGKDVILGPGVNIVRTPLNGRNFEYIGEDPFHVANTATAAIQGIQENDVAACIKHFALNNQELDRMKVDVLCADRPLREIYLPAFEKGVKEGKVLTVMGAYNKFRGQHCCHHELLLQKILKQEWGFPGLVVSDWGGVHDGEEAARNGLDVEMGGKINNLFLDQPFLQGLRDGTYPEALLDEKVRRILRVMLTIGKDQHERQTGVKNTARHQKIARQMATEAFVLLQNEKNFLPLQEKKIKTLAVIGENATLRHASGGGSSGIKAQYEITPLEGLQEILGDQVEIIHAKGYPSLPGNFTPIPTDLLEAPDVAGIGGWRKEIYAARSPQGEPVSVETVPEVSFPANSPPPIDRPVGQWSIMWKGRIKVPESETVEWVIYGWDNWFVRIDGEPLASVWNLTAPGLKKETFTLEANRTYEISIALNPRTEGASLQFGWCRSAEKTTVSSTEDTDQTSEALEAARRADAVLFFGGTTHMQDVEAMDRPNFDLPGGQNELLDELVSVNPNLAVVLLGGSAVRLPWQKKVPAIVQGWYPGSEGGRALADLLFGRTCPSGKLPFSWPAELDHCAAHAKDAYRDEQVDYREGLFTGYRWHDLPDSPKPLFPFGYGLSYTRFTLKDPSLETPTGEDQPGKVKVTVQNTGDIAGAEVVQMYVAPQNPPVPRPGKELKGFAKVFLQPGESRQITLPLQWRDLSYWDDQKNGWTVAPGTYQILLGNRSDHCPLELTLKDIPARDC
ncbi:MAG: glycoside hydrolase family 3 C-terminal domain-containing protein [Opitutales bacterium]|nr:glycoside hydrolase family 3 C-terminal domain-containing protein [Opitutales bacterium]MCH8540711.1 glycoside hydrolase family 3 C-terminal domain-containing protein [Opitutales bacterium]